MPALFDFDRVCVHHHDVAALDGLTLGIDDGGGVTCLLGPSGSGKSTILRLCNRLVAPTSGTVRFRGVDLANVDVLDHRRRVGMVFQRPTMFPGTVRDNLLVADPDAAEEAMAEALDRAQLEPGILGRRGESLSGGEAQRACLARTLITGPEVLLMDEPTSALDPAATNELEKLSRGLADFGTPVLWVTHDVAQAERIADRRIVIVRGRPADEQEIEHFLAGRSGPNGDEEGTDG